MHKIINYIFLIVCVMTTAPLYAKDGWTVNADMVSGTYFGVSVANGGIGIVPWNEPFSVDRVVMNHSFDTDGFHGVSRAIRGINPFNIVMDVNGTKVTADDVTGMSQSLDMSKAVHHTSFTIPGKAEVKYDVRALRQLAYTGLVVVEVTALNDITLSFNNDFFIPDGYKDVEKKKVKTSIEGDDFLFLKAWGETKYRSMPVAVAAAFVGGGSDLTEVNVRLKRGETFRTALAGSVCTGNDFLDPYNEADREVILVLHQGLDKIISDHERLWDELWQGDIVIDGDEDAQEVVRMALYHLYSFCREGSRLSISPFGLSAQGYNGHIFWDTELWMYPPMLFLNQGIAEAMMEYRIDRLQGARKKASTYGYRGAMFPWESDYSGEEACPTFALTGLIEQHITSDIAIATWNYYRMTKDLDWLKDEGWALLRECAEFWCSRVTFNEDGSCSIVDVVGADEYAQGVTDNAFTNGSAIVALRNAVKAARELGFKAPEKWSRTADAIRILKDKDGKTLEYEGYNWQKIKQADVNLLAYPLQLVTAEKDIRRDLEAYEKVMDPNGPAMSFSILALEYSRLGDGKKAYELFHRAFNGNRLPPFGVISEGAGGTNPYFATGAGGILQTVINGFGGLELTDEGIKQLPSALPPHWKMLTIKGVGPEKMTYTVKSK